MNEKQKTCWEFEGKRCPRCGASVNTDGKVVWCSFVGSQRNNIAACSYGIDDRITIEQHESIQT